MLLSFGIVCFRSKSSRRLWKY